MPKTNLTEEERYWAKVDRRGDDECWPWTASTNKSGYGTFGVNGGSVLAHRYGYKLAFGPFDPDLCVLHHCDSPPCQNPACFFLGTRTDNNADRHAKGRSARGERMGAHVVLTEDTVRAMNSLYHDGVEVPAIAAQFGINLGTLKSVIEGRSWVHLGLEWPKRRILDATKVREIRSRFAKGENRRTIAADFGIKPKYINEIASRRAWAAVV